MTARRLTRGTFVAITLLLAAAMPAIAEQGCAESPDFTVNTVPEAAAIIAVAGALLLARRSTRRILCVLLALLVWSGLPLFAAKPVVTNVCAFQTGNVVDIQYDVFDAGGHTQTISAAVSTNSGLQYIASFTNFEGTIGAGIPTGTHKHITWKATEDLPMFTSGTVRVKVTSDEGECLVVDVSDGPSATNYPVTRLSCPPVLNDEYKTTKILLRMLPAGNFVMGSPIGELGRNANETQHRVTLSSNFYMGVFEITQGQYSNVMGSNPAYFPQGTNGPKRPVEQVSWNTIRGGIWPGSPAGSGAPTNTSFMGVLRAKTGLAFDLPTEAQWEYACRAGTTNALNNNTNLTNIYSDGNMDILGRYWYNGGYACSTNPVSGAHTVAGSYLVNNWGLYDMHGNVWEWCLDWYVSSYGGNATDPQGPATGSVRVIRGGSWSAARSTAGLRTGTATRLSTRASASGFVCPCPQVSLNGASQKAERDAAGLLGTRSVLFLLGHAQRRRTFLKRPIGGYDATETIVFPALVAGTNSRRKPGQVGGVDAPPKAPVDFSFGNTLSESSFGKADGRRGRRPSPGIHRIGQQTLSRALSQTLPEWPPQALSRKNRRSSRLSL